MTLTDGSERSAPMHEDTEAATSIMCTTIDLENWAVYLVSATGQKFVAEAGGDRSPWTVANRPVVYLDQWVWVRLAQYVHTPDKLQPAELGAAAQLIDWANHHQLVLPLSMGHLAESTHARDRFRTTLIPVMLQLSHGWQMRDILSVRGEELHHLFSKIGGLPVDTCAATEVMTLDEGKIFRNYVPATSTLSAGTADVHRFVTWISAHYSALLDEERDDNTHATTLASKWTTAFHNLAQHLRTDNHARTNSRQVTFSLLMRDIQNEVANAAALATARGADPGPIQAWFLGGQANSTLAPLPFLGTLYEAIHARVRNAGDNWETHDFADMHYLSCAAAYADTLVCEKKAADYLTRARRGRTGGATIRTTWPALIQHLTPMLDTASSRT